MYNNHESASCTPKKEYWMSVHIILYLSFFGCCRKFYFYFHHRVNLNGKSENTIIFSSLLFRYFRRSLWLILKPCNSIKPFQFTVFVLHIYKPEKKERTILLFCKSAWQRSKKTIFLLYYLRQNAVKNTCAMDDHPHE